jgi:RHS repeat-associated protein
VPVVEGENTVQVVARDASGNARTNQFKFVVGPVESSFTYDAKGNLLTDGSRVFTWDSMSRLKSVTAGGHTYSWTYDGDGRRRTEAKDGALQKQWLWAGLAIIQERNATSAVVKNYYPAGEFVPTQGGQPAQKIFYTRDHLGSIRELVDASGTIRARYDYDPYGKLTKISGDLVNEFAYTGHYYHAPSGLHLAPYRAYDSNLGRWLSRDPLGEMADGPNLYSYVLNNPISLWDPYGLLSFDDVSDFAAGWGDAVSFGLTAKIRESLPGVYGDGGGVDKCSTGYGLGEFGGLANGLAMGGAHLGRNALSQMGKGGLGRGLGRLAHDNRTWDSVRRTWSQANGGLRNNGASLHHTFIPQRWGFVPQGIRNAGFNYMPISSGLNSWMNGSTMTRQMAEWGLKGAAGMLELSPFGAGRACP